MLPRPPHRHAARACGALLRAACALALLAPTAPGLSPQQEDERVPPQVDPLVADTVAFLLSPPASGSEPDLEQTLEQLVGLGPAVVPIACGVMCGEIALPDVAVGTDGEPIHPTVAAARHELLQRCLMRQDASVIVSHLQLRAGGDAPLETRLVAARLLGEVEHDRALDVLLELASGIEPIHLQRAYVCSSFEVAIAEQMRRPATSVGRLRGLERRTPRSVRPLLVRAAGAAATPESADFLTSLLGRDEATDLAVARQIAQARDGALLEVPPSRLPSLRQRLFSSESEVRRITAAALGRLQDVDSVELMVEQMAQAEPLEAQSLRRALQEISGSDLGPQYAAWERWLSEENAWWRYQAPRELERLNSGDPLEVHQALQALVRHPLRRHDVALAVGPLVSENDAAIATSACRALARLGSSEALPWLLEALADIEEARREEATLALRALTGLDLPADYVAWTRALGPRVSMR